MEKIKSAAHALRTALNVTESENAQKLIKEVIKETLFEFNDEVITIQLLDTITLKILSVFSELVFPSDKEGLKINVTIDMKTLTKVNIIPGNLFTLLIMNGMYSPYRHVKDLTEISFLGIKMRYKPNGESSRGFTADFQLQYPE